MASPGQRNVFISYKQVDTESKLCIFLENALKEARMSPFLGKDLRKGEEFAPAIMKALNEANVVVIVASPNYFDSKWCVKELHTAMEMYKGGRAKILPVFYDLSPDDCKLAESSLNDWKGSGGDAGSDAWLNDAPTSAKKFTKIQGINRLEHDADNRRLTKAIVNEVAQLLGIKLPSAYGNNLPFAPNANFCGRVDELNFLQRSFEKDKPNTVCICGMSGMGKSQLALQYAHNNDNNYNWRLWVTGNSFDALQTEYLALAEVLGIQKLIEGVPIDDAILIVRNTLQSLDGVLLILDNAHRIETTEMVPPTGTCHVIITTTTRGTFPEAHLLELKALKKEDAYGLVGIGGQTLSEKEQHALERICKDVGYLTICLSWVSTMMAKGRLPSNILDKLERQMDIGGPKHDARRRRTITLRHLFDATLKLLPDSTEEGRLALDVLLVGGWFAPGPVRLAVLGAAVESYKGSSIQDNLIDDASYLLVEHSLAIRQDTAVLNFHTVAQRCQRMQDGAHDAALAVLRSLGRPPANAVQDTEHFRQACIWVHFLESEDGPGSPRGFHYIELPSNDKLAFVTSVVMPFAEVLYVKARYKQAEAMYSRALGIYQKAHGNDHPNVANTLNNLANVLYSQGRYKEAEGLHRRALGIHEKVLGADHPDVASSLDGLANVLYCQGQYKEAEAMYNRAHGIYQKAPGNDHPNVATSLVGLANVLHDQGRYEEAEAMHRRALGIYQKAHGNDHPNVAMSLNNLANVLYSQGRYEEAEGLHRRALGIREKVRDKDHPDVANSLTNLASVLGSLGRHEEAEGLHRRALGIYEKVLGADHPNVASSLNNLASVLKAPGQYEAEGLHRRALGIRERVLHKDHPDVAWSLCNLATVLDSQGRYEEAEGLHRRALGIRERVLDKDHPDVATSLNNLANVLQAQGRYEEAEGLHRRALGIREKVLDKDHPDVAKSLNNLANVLYSQGRYEEAEGLCRRVLGILERVLDEDHPHVANSLNNLANVLYSQGRYEEAEGLHRRALGILERVLDKDHPHVANSLNNLADVLYSQGRYEEAKDLYRHALGILERVLGADHPDTMRTRKNLANVRATCVIL